MDDLLSLTVRSPKFNCFQALVITPRACYPTPRPRSRQRPLDISRPNRRLSEIACSNGSSSALDSNIVSAIEWSETERNVTSEQSAAVVEEVSDVIGKEEMLEKKPSHVLRKHAKMRSKRRQKNQPVKDISVRQDKDSDVTKTLDNRERLSEKTVSVCGSKEIVCHEDAFNEKANSEILSPVTAPTHDNVNQEQDNNAFDGSHESNGKARVGTSSVDSKLELVFNKEKACSSLEDLHDKVIGETTIHFANLGSECETDTLNTSAFREITQESQNTELIQVSTAANDHNVELMSNHETGEDGAGGRTIEEIPETTALEVDSIVDDRTDSNSLDVSSRAQCSEMLDVFASSTKKEDTKPDALRSKTTEVPVSFAEESQSIGTSLKRDEISARLFLSSGAVSLAHPFKASTDRGDAYFVCQNWLGIADGLGQWSYEGTRAGIYAQELMHNCKKILLENKDVTVIDPVEVLHRSVVETKSPGFSTVLVAYFDGQALHVANIGDSGFVVIRHMTVFKRSSPMVHEFHCPILIGSGDAPSEHVEGYKVDLDDGDVIVTATDGLFDNLYEQEIASIISKSLQDGYKPQEISEALAVRAQEVGKSQSARSPFADAAQAAGYVGYRGGKLDEVTVIVSILKNSCSTPS